MGLPYTIAYSVQDCIDVCVSAGTTACAAAVWYNGNACVKYTSSQTVGQVMTPSPDPNLPRTLIVRCTMPATSAPTIPPATQAPVTQAPATSAPTIQVGATQPPATSAPATSAPATSAPFTQPPPTPTPTGPRMIFQDEFNKLDFSVWEHELTLAGDGNFCFQEYTNNRTNSYVKNGILYIKPTLTSAIIGQGGVTGNPSTTIDLASLEPAMQCTGDAFWGCTRTSTSDNYLNPIQSAALRTAHSFSFKYGRVEIRAKLPRGDWIWPAIWMLPRWSEYGQWPMSGEIDIMESRGNAPGYPYHGSDYIGSTLHWGPYYPQDPFDKTRNEYQLPNGQSFADAFHIFGLYWDSTGLYTYVDNDSNKVLKVNWTTPTTSNNYFYDLGQFNQTLHSHNPWAYSSKGAPFDQEFYLILNVAVGGAVDYFYGDAQRPWKNDQNAMKDFWNARSQWLPTWQGDDAAMQVDYVRVWQ
jgi:beta-glucanase (GH16 family)